MKRLVAADRFTAAAGGDTGFRLPDGSVLSPDASLVRLERWQALNPEQRRSFPPL